LVFVAAQSDRRVSEAVLHNHMYRPRNEPEGYVNPAFILGAGACVAGVVEERGQDTDDAAEIYVKDETARPEAQRTFTLAFLKKYVHYAKNKCQPRLTDRVREYITKEYVNLRAERRPKVRYMLHHTIHHGQDAPALFYSRALPLPLPVQSLPITARTLECLVRLSTAVARARLNDEIQPEDAREAVQMLKFALYAEEPEVDDEDLTFDNAEADQEHAAAALAKKEGDEKRKARKARLAAGAQPWELSDDDDDEQDEGEADEDEAEADEMETDQPRAGKRRQAPESTTTYVLHCTEQHGVAWPWPSPSRPWAMYITARCGIDGCVTSAACNACGACLVEQNTGGQAGAQGEGRGLADAQDDRQGEETRHPAHAQARRGAQGRLPQPRLYSMHNAACARRYGYAISTLPAPVTAAGAPAANCGDGRAAGAVSRAARRAV
jgi:hypothetical protein